MAFIAECPFCRVKLQKVPDHREGDSTECPRCRNLFTLAIMISPPKPREMAPRRVAKKAAVRATSAAATATSSSANHEVLHVQPVTGEPAVPAAAAATL